MFAFTVAVLKSEIVFMYFISCPFFNILLLFCGRFRCFQKLCFMTQCLVLCITAVLGRCFSCFFVALQEVIVHRNAQHRNIQNSPALKPVSSALPEFLFQLALGIGCSQVWEEIFRAAASFQSFFWQFVSLNVHLCLHLNS